MSAAKIIPYYTIADWERWEGNWELVEGLRFAVSPAPMPKHQRISGNLFSLLNEELKNCKTCKVYQAIDWIITDDTILQPDVLVVCKPVKHRLNFPPELVVEILSPATALKDRNSKFEIYQQQQVKYYLIIDPNTDGVEVFELINGIYKLQTYTSTFKFSFSNNCFANADFTAIWE